MKVTIEIQKKGTGIYSDDLVHDCLCDLFYAFERFPEKESIPARYIDRQIAKAQRIEYLAKALKDSLKAIKKFT